jgi:uncharacterized membrane protein YfcA
VVELLVSLPQFVLLLLASFFGSLLSAALGVGGGSFLMIVMANILPPAALIPVHGFVQLASNGGRAILTRAHFVPTSIFPFWVGAALAALIGVFLFAGFNSEWIPLLVAIFILWLCWGKMPKLNLGTSKLGMFVGGLVTSYASLFVGASGPLVSAWVGNQQDDRWRYTSIFSSCMTVQHLLKLVVFGVLGFAYADWLALIIGMIASGYIGTKAGLRLLAKFADRDFKLVFKLVLTLLAIRAIWVNLAPHL